MATPDRSAPNTGNYEFALRIAQFADVLAEYDHLPQLDVATLSTRQRVHVGAYDDPARALGQWAAAFDRPVQISVELGGTQVATAVVVLSGWVLMFKETAPPAPTGWMSASRFLELVDGAPLAVAS